MPNPNQDPKAHSLRLQSSMEYIITYGWAILIIAIAVAIIYYYIQSTAVSTPPTCTFSSNIYCDDIILSANAPTANGTVTVLLTNSQPYSLKDPQIYADINDVNTTITACKSKYVLSGGSILCTFNLTTPAHAGQLFVGDIYLTAQYCGLNATYISTNQCGAAPMQTYIGTFSAHAQQQEALQPQVSITAQNTIGYAPGIAIPINITILLNGIPLKGATVQLTEDNSIFQLSPTYSTTNMNGKTFGYVSSNAPGNVVVTANYSGYYGNIILNFNPALYDLFSSYTSSCGVSSSTCELSYPIGTPNSVVAVVVAIGGGCYGNPCTNIVGDDPYMSNLPSPVCNPCKCDLANEDSFYGNGAPYTGNSVIGVYELSCSNEAIGNEQISITNIGGSNGYYEGYAIAVYVFAPSISGSFSAQSLSLSEATSSGGQVAPYSYSAGGPGTVAYLCTTSDPGYASLSLNGPLFPGTTEHAALTGQYGYATAVVDLQTNPCMVTSNVANTEINIGQINLGS